MLYTPITCNIETKAKHLKFILKYEKINPYASIISTTAPNIYISKAISIVIYNLKMKASASKLSSLPMMPIEARSSNNSNAKRCQHHGKNLKIYSPN